MSEFAPNKSNQAEFTIVGFSSSQKHKIPMFLLFLIIYLFAVLSNLVTITLFFLDRNLHKPMYFFLCNLSILDILYISVTVPNHLHMIISQNKRISFRSCMAQLFLFNSFGTVEYMLVTSMAYDRYQAVCNPLSYHQKMNRKTCCILSRVAWIGGFSAALPISISVSSLPFCSSHQINHIFCDVSPLLKIACGDTTTCQLIIFGTGAGITLNCLILTLTSYVFIIFAILKIRSTKGRIKTFSTCASHLAIVILFYTMIASMYMKPPSSYSLDEAKVQSVLFNNIIPLLNPMIYTLKNNDMKEAVKK
ncbi:hypothetical protein GDO86_020519, partial [Hymenochirus boettgeri]